MNTIEKGGLKIVIWETEKEFPAGRFNAFQKFKFEEWGIGSQMSDVDQRLANLVTLVTAWSSKEKALQELQNLRMSMNYCLNTISFPSYAMACFVKSIDSKEFVDYSETGLKEVVTILEKNLSQGEIEDLVEAIKKKLSPN
jgi:hypothetical protein